jgi:Zn finger protein HypA/HybF involved in hydrogenase expression
MPTEATTASSSTSHIDTWIKLAAAIVGAGTFIFGIYTYQETAERQLAQSKREADQIAETRLIEASKPFLEKQLKLFTEATVVTALIATSDDPEQVAKARARFLQLYVGELALVERGQVETAMSNFKNALEGNQSRIILQSRALDLAHACRDELAKAWRTDAWERYVGPEKAEIKK